jgi:hypothetical protein
MIVTIKFKNKETLQLNHVWSIKTKQHLLELKTLSDQRTFLLCMIDDFKAQTT